LEVLFFFFFFFVSLCPFSSEPISSVKFVLLVSHSQLVVVGGGGVGKSAITVQVWIQFGSFHALLSHT
jgi:hypothetical protein